MEQLMEQPTEQQIQGHISAAFDSVGLIQRIVAGQEQAVGGNLKARVEANVGHLNIMLGKTWFADALTEQQRTDIDAVIASGNEYVAAN